MTMPEGTLRSGFVSIVGRPNSGKSTLLNSLVGQKISIVTDKPQTTRQVVRGVVTRDKGQLIFLDTPGVHKPTHRMNSGMMKIVRDALSEVDVLALIVDCSVPFGKGDEYTLELIKPARIPKLLLLNKIDKIPKKDLLPWMERYSRLDDFSEILPVSALKGDNVERFVDCLFRYVPEGPLYYPEDQISDSTERAIAGEIIREKVIEMTRDELPHATAVAIDAFEEGTRLHRIHATIYVERESQKGIVIGKGGALLKEIGSTARRDLERFLSKQIFLSLRVSVLAGWRDDERKLKDLGLGTE